MPVRHAEAVWKGDIAKGKGSMKFRHQAETAKKNCPVSQALAGTEIELDARLVS
ncbi:MAG: hypothetical protein ACYC6Y_05385 [Thermoguttaceae bacterium]